MLCLSVVSQLEGDRDNKGDSDDLDPLSIDAFWLQRQLNKFYDDAVVSKMTCSVLSVLVLLALLHKFPGKYFHTLVLLFVSTLLPKSCEIQCVV